MAVLAAVAFLAAAAPASAKTYPAIGGSGDASLPVSCNGGRYIVGFAGRVGSWTDQISLECSQVIPQLNGREAIAPRQSQTAYGGPGGSPTEDHCRAGELVTGIYLILTHDNGKVWGIYYACNPIGGSRISAGELGGPNSDFRHFIGAAANSNVDWGARDHQECPANEYATGYNIRYGKHVNAIGLICSELPPPPTPALKPTQGPPLGSPPGPVAVGPTPHPSAPQAVAAPPPPPKVRTIPVESAAPLVNPPAYAGVWSVTTTQGVRYTMSIQVNGANVAGIFSNAQNSALSGTFTGAILNGRASIKWVQPQNANAVGTAIIRVHADNTFGGGITDHPPGSPQPAYHEWYGVRQ